MVAETQTPSPQAELKRLGFVQQYAKTVAGGAATVEQVYRERVRPLVPKQVEPYVVRAEDTVVAYAAPALTAASDTAEKLLKQTDEQLDLAYITAARWLSLEPLRELHSSNMAAYKSAADKYFALVKQTTDHLAARFGSTELSVKHARELVAAALQKAEQLADPDAAVQAVSDAWAKFAAIPTVAKVLRSASPLTQKGLHAFVAAHDLLVASPAYKRSLSLGASTLNWATTTTPYKLGAHYLYPLVQPLADPALDRVSKSEVVGATLRYWQPVAAA